MEERAQVVRPVCYMVMPFRKKKVEEPRPPGAPVEIDFDALWEKVYWPVIDKLGYQPVRADCDPHTAIVKAMLERIAFADLVLADITLGNGNVYYEVGIRHAAKERNCVLLAPAWSRPLFDLDQFVSVRFPLVDGSIPETEAAGLRDFLERAVRPIMESRTPFFELIADSLKDKGKRGAFEEFAERLSHFQAEVKAVRLEENEERQRRMLAALRASLTDATLTISEVALDLVVLIRNLAGWRELVAFIEALPASTRKLPFVREQYLLGLAKLDAPGKAIAQLEQLIQEQGDSPERSGLIGGRYKDLWRAARAAREARREADVSVEEERLLEKAIESYRRGMELDYNQYYCSNNLALLLRARGGEEDLEEAPIVDHFVVAACERALARKEGDEWLRSTLLGAAFRAGNAKLAADLAKKVRIEGQASWQLETTLKDLAESVRQTADLDKKAKLSLIYAELERLLPRDSPPAPA